MHAGAGSGLVPALHIAATSHAARLLDGRDVVIREATTGDLAGIVDFFERNSPASRHSRFFTPKPRLRRDMIARIVAAGGDRCSVLAQPAGFSATTRNVVGVGGWDYVPRDARAEISIAVADPWQGNMLGTYLVMVLVRTAVAAGHTHFAADVLDTNARMLGLLRDLGARTHSRCEAGVVRVEFDLPAQTAAPTRRDSEGVGEASIGEASI